MSTDQTFSLTQHTPVQWQCIKLEVFKHHSNGDDILPQQKNSPIL
jgi:hypothetical protein